MGPGEWIRDGLTGMRGLTNTLWAHGRQLRCLDCLQHGGFCTPTALLLRLPCLWKIHPRPEPALQEGSRIVAILLGAVERLPAPRGSFARCDQDGCGERDDGGTMSRCG